MMKEEFEKFVGETVSNEDYKKRFGKSNTGSRDCKT